MNDAKRNSLIARMGRLKRYNGGVAAEVMPLVSVEEYFDGAEGEAPLWCNTGLGSDEDAIRDRLADLRARPEVLDLRIAVVNADDEEWPFSDKILVVTKEAAETIAALLPEGLAPDEYWEGDVDHLPTEPIAIPPGYRKVWMWYD